MSDERTKPVWPWIVAVTIGLPVLYVLSGAPVEILVVKMAAPEWLVVPGKAFYAPLVWMLGHSPDPVNNWYQAYGQWCIAIFGEP